MNKFKTLLFLAAFSGIGLWGCDDSSSASSNGPDESATAESSSSLKDSDTAEDLSSSIDKAQESSSSMKYSSSEDKNSSSSVEKSNSSSSYVADYCKEGDIDTLYQEKRTVYVHCDGGYWKTDSIVYDPQPKEYPVMDSLFETKYSTYGEFEDPRDHQSYKTVILNMHDGDGMIVEGEKIEVFAQNLNYGEMIDTSKKIHDDTKVEKYCDLNDEWFCDNGWGGGRYTWSEAMGLSAKYDSVLWKDTVGGDTRIHQGLCPGGGI
ncbi:fibrobacter succinogenes major paralogous domain-containing protein [Hallerella porci]|uniref:Uncharacterized protein (TIGR02145 family) n=1 Tax=Hallerella porci TaxID=1945871 RepID=A0ABX5LI36_9BACT|nr:hypothetical protein [Hallerella porci]PWK88725.1 uncharacterized protein (TIGR02145 family) [Hallerella porci]